MKTLTALLKSGSDLNPKQVEEAVHRLTATETPDADKVEFLRALGKKGETAEEIAAFARALLAHAVPLDLDRSRLPGPTIDICGTGGDRQGFFNISTTAMFVVAACGACVVKHGNRSITSKSGAADVLEELSVRISLSPEDARAALEEHGVAFIFAPAYHPALKAVAPARRALAEEGVPTIFNLLGPLLNPARPDYQLVGIYSATLLPKYAEVLRSLGRKRAWAVHGSGTDEITLTGRSQVHAVDNGKLSTFTIDPREYGLDCCVEDDLRGGDSAENANLLVRILEGDELGHKREVILLNAAAACVVAGIATDMRDGLARAAEAIDSGAAMGKLNVLRAFYAV